MMFTASLTQEFAARTEKIKQAFIIDTLRKIEQLKDAIAHKKTIVMQAISCLHHIQFEAERGLILDQFSSINDDGSSMMTDKSLVLDKMYKGKDKEEMKKLKARNKREIEQFEKDNVPANGSNGG